MKPAVSFTIKIFDLEGRGEKSGETLKTAVLGAGDVDKYEQDGQLYKRFQWPTVVASLMLIAGLVINIIQR